MRTDFDAQWDELAAEVLSGMKEWRLQHPKATLREIEAALDERLGKMRARMLQDAALASAAADLKAAQAPNGPCVASAGACWWSGRSPSGSSSRSITGAAAGAQVRGLSHLRDGPFSPG